MTTPPPGTLRRAVDVFLAVTEKLLAPSSPGVRSGRLTGAGPIGVQADSLAVARRQEYIDAEAALDGFYLLRTPVSADELGAPAVVAAYKSLRDFRHIKASMTRPGSPTAASAVCWSTWPP
jgi:hypothetical protein